MQSGSVQRCWVVGRRWAPHLQLNAVNDGDIIFMHQQSRNNRAAGPSPNFATHYFTPGDSDRWCSGMGRGLALDPTGLRLLWQ